MEDDEPFTLEAAWAGLQHAISLMLAVFGSALDIAERLILPRAARIEILQWLAQLEATARRLLVIEALSLPAPNAPPPFIPKGKLASTYADTQTPDLPADETKWNVRFNAWRGGVSQTRQKSAIAPPPQTHPIRYNAIPLARRIEALRRVFFQRQTYAARLAMRLHHAPNRARKAFAAYRHRAPAVQTLLRRVQREVDLALARLNTT